MTILYFLWCKYSQGFPWHLIGSKHWFLGAFMALHTKQSVSTESVEHVFCVWKFIRLLFQFLLSPTPQCHHDIAVALNQYNIINATSRANRTHATYETHITYANHATNKQNDYHKLNSVPKHPRLQLCKMSVWLESIKLCLIHLYVTAVLLNNFCSSSFLEEILSWLCKEDDRKGL